jgi:creatinine amidohydrolase
MRMSTLNWFDVQSYLETDDRVILVLGSCEQHGYLSLQTDVKIPLALADAAGKESGVLIAPPVNYGMSAYFLGYPGTMSLRIATLMDLVEDLIQSLYQQGFKRILVLNGHGGNDPVRSRLYEISNDLPLLRLAWYGWWQSHSLEEIFRKYQLKPSHASWLEAFPFTIVGDLPKNEKQPPFVPGLVNAAEARKIYGDGNFGGPYQVDPSIMQEIFATCLKDILHLLKFTR